MGFVRWLSSVRRSVGVVVAVTLLCAGVVVGVVVANGDRGESARAASSGSSGATKPSGAAKPSAAAKSSAANESPKALPACERLPKLGGFVVIGDSITARAARYLAAVEPTWHVDGAEGRWVDEIDARIDAYLAEFPQPRVAVLALGTNERGRWSKKRYESAVQKFPSRTRVVFVTTFRNGHKSDGAAYSQWMTEIAAERPRTVIADWRTAAMSAPRRLMVDRLHPLHPTGYNEWVVIVRAAVAAAETEGAAVDAQVREDRRAGRCR